MKVSALTKVAPLAIAAALMAAPASAADLIVKAPKVAVVETPSQFDIAFGALVQTDYNFRGISQSNRGGGVGAYFEPRYKFGNVEAYVGVGGLSTTLPTQPTAEIDLYGGLRYTAGAFTFDVGGIYYLYPREKQLFCIDAGCTGVSPQGAFGAFSLRDTDFAEVYGKVNWTVNDWLGLGAYVFYSPDWLNTGATGTYAGATAKITAPSSMFASGWGAYVSAEVAHYWFGTPSAFFTLPFADYTYWNAGLGITYKAMTLDLRYHDTDLSRGQCFALTGDPSGAASGQSKWCGQAFVAKLSFDTTLSAIK